MQQQPHLNLRPNRPFHFSCPLLLPLRQRLVLREWNRNICIILPIVASADGTCSTAEACERDVSRMDAPGTFAGDGVGFAAVEELVFAAVGDAVDCGVVAGVEGECEVAHFGGDGEDWDWWRGLDVRFGIVGTYLTLLGSQ